MKIDWVDAGYFLESTVPQKGSLRPRLPRGHVGSILNKLNVKWLPPIFVASYYNLRVVGKMIQSQIMQLVELKMKIHMFSFV